MYHVISTALTATVLYLISYFFYRIGYYSLQVHRRLWNLILAIAFILAAIAGIFLALQINYKWNIVLIKEILKWHVEFGIGLAVSGIFHLTWHFGYYGKYLGKNETKNESPQINTKIFPEIRTNLFITGFASTSVQLLLMKEMMNITGGYELITGAFLGSWLIGSAIGSSLAARSTQNDISKINLVFAIGPAISLFLMLFLSRIFLSPGQTPSFLVSLLYTIIVLLPYCIISGFTFIKLIRIAGSDIKLIPGKSFSIETAGGITSGIIVSFLTVVFLGTYKLVLLIVLLSLTYVVVSYYIKETRTKTGFKLVVLFISSVLILSEPDIVFRQILLPSIKVTFTEDTPYGNITTGNYAGEKSLYYNQKLLSYNNDVGEREEDIHYAMLQSESPQKVMMISGSITTRLPEILKYDVSKVIYIERDPGLIRYMSVSDSSNSGRLVTVNNDALRYIRNSSEDVDVIIMLVPPPTTLLLNRYYTTEFFSEVKKKLKSDGIFMCSPGPGDTYLNKESINLYSSIYNSLSTVFSNVQPVVGNKLYLIASDKALSSSFCQLVEKKKIKTIYVNSDFLDDKLLLKKSEEVKSLIDKGIRQNRSVFPVASFHSQSYQFSKNINEKIPAMILMLAIFALPVVTVKRRNLIMYLSASALAGFEIIILLTLQIIVGNMYQLTGLVIAGLMTGLAIGSGINNRILDNISIRNKVIIQIVFYVILGVLYNFMIGIKSGFPAVVLIIGLCLIPGIMTGRIFRELTQHSAGADDPSSIYSADLLGSALGFIFISGFAVPLFGIQNSLYILSALIFAGIVFGTIRNGR